MATLMFEPPPLPFRPPALPSVEASVVEEPPRHLRDYLRVLAARRTLALTVFGAVLLVTLLVVLLAPRRYTASTRLQVARQAPIQLRLKDNVRRGDDPDDPRADVSTFVATQIATLQSRDLAERVIRHRHLLGNEAFLRPGTGQQDLLAGAGSVPRELRPRGWDPAPAADPGTKTLTRHVDSRLLDRYMRYLNVREVRGTDLIEVSFTTPSPSLSAFLAAAHTEAYLEANQEAQQSTDVVARRFLTRQLGDARRQLDAAQAVLEDFAAAHPRVAVDQKQTVLTARVGELSSLLTKAEGTRTTLEARYAFLTRPGTDAVSYFLDSPGIQKLRLTLLDVRAQRAGLDSRLGPNHPQIVELRQLEGEVDRQIAAEVGRAVAGVRARYDDARMREAHFRKKLERIEQAGVALYRLGAQFDRRKQDVEAAQKLYASLQKQQMETAVNAELFASNVRVIERAEVPRRPSQPKIPLLLMLGVFTGVLGGVGAAFLRDYFDPSVRSSEEVEELLRLPTLATIPNFALVSRLAPTPGGGLPALASHCPPAGAGADRESELLVVHEPWSAVAEAFRSMRAAVLFSVRGLPPKLILITSARAAEGKTVTCVNLAGALAEGGARVLLIDGDLRHPRCHVALGKETGPGLAAVLAGTADLDDAIQAAGPPGLFFLPAGSPSSNPAELVTSARLRETLRLLRGRFDFVVLDTPPILPVTDAAVLAREADGVVLVVKGHDTPRELVRRARDRLVLAGANFLGVMVNNVGHGWADPYFYDQYYGGGRPGRAEGA